MTAQSVPDWLADLKDQLAYLRAEGIALIEGLATVEGPQWRDQIGDCTVQRVTNPAITAQTSGWLIAPLQGQSQPCHLFIATRLRLRPEDPRLAAAAAMCRQALKHRHEHDKRLSQSRAPFHALRNGLNSAGMTAAVLVQGHLPAALQPFAHDLQDSVQRCLQALKQLSAVIEPGVASLWGEAEEVDQTLLRATHDDTRRDAI